jgi:hypothetical protein
MVGLRVSVCISVPAAAVVLKLWRVLMVARVAAAAVTVPRSKRVARALAVLVTTVGAALQRLALVVVAAAVLEPLVTTLQQAKQVTAAPVWRQVLPAQRWRERAAAAAVSRLGVPLALVALVAVVQAQTAIRPVLLVQQTQVAAAALVVLAAALVALAVTVAAVLSS